MRYELNNNRNRHIANAFSNSQLNQLQDHNLQGLQHLLKLDTSQHNQRFLAKFRELKNAINPDGTTTYPIIKELCKPSFLGSIKCWWGGDSYKAERYKIIINQLKTGGYQDARNNTISYFSKASAAIKQSICQKVEEIKNEYLTKTYSSEEDAEYKADSKIFAELENFNQNLGFKPSSAATINVQHLPEDNLEIWQAFTQTNPEYSCLTPETHTQDSRINIRKKSILTLKQEVLTLRKLTPNQPLFDTNNLLHKKVGESLKCQQNIVFMLKTRVQGFRAQKDFAVATQIHTIMENLSAQARIYFQPLLSIKPIGKIDNSSPIVVGDLDGSFGREILALVQTGCISLTPQGVKWLTELLENEANTELIAPDLKRFQSSTTNATLIEDICNQVSINENMLRPLIFMGDVINDRFTCNQPDSMKLRELIHKIHHDKLIYIAGNHEYSKYYAIKHRQIAHGYYAQRVASITQIDKHLKTCFQAAYFDKKANTLYTHTPIQMIKNGFYNTLFGMFKASSPQELTDQMNQTLLNGDTAALGEMVAITQEGRLRTNHDWYSTNYFGIKFGDEYTRSGHGHDGKPSLKPRSAWQICVNSNNNQPFACVLGATY